MMKQKNWTTPTNNSSNTDSAKQEDTTKQQEPRTNTTSETGITPWQINTNNNQQIDRQHLNDRILPKTHTHRQCRQEPGVRPSRAR